MGFMTNVTILNDHFDWVEKNPETFVKAIKYGMVSGSDEELWLSERHRIPEVEEASRHYVTVHKAEHADVDQVILSVANSAHAVHELAFGRAKVWVERWGQGSDNARVRIGILRGVINKLRWYADRLEADLDQIEKDQESDDWTDPQGSGWKGD